MTELLQLIETCNKHLTEAETCLARLKERPETAKLKEVLDLLERSEVVYGDILVQKRELLNLLIKISLTMGVGVGKGRSYVAGTPEREYYFTQGRRDWIVNYTGAPRAGQTSVEDFAVNEPDETDYTALCRVIVNEAMEHLQHASKKSSQNVGELEKLMDELRRLIEKK